jgi:hypothetical protein
MNSLVWFLTLCMFYHADVFILLGSMFVIQAFDVLDINKDGVVSPKELDDEHLVMFHFIKYL